MDPTPAALTYAAEARDLSGRCGHVVLAPGPAAIAERLMQAPGKLLPRAVLIEALGLPETVDAEAEDLLRKHLKVVRVLAAALSGGSMQLVMRGQESVGLMSTKKRPAGRGIGSESAFRTMDLNGVELHGRV